MGGGGGGQLIVAVVRDPNEEYFSLAVAVVEAETKDSWTWFINLLLADIGDSKRWTSYQTNKRYFHILCL